VIATPGDFFKHCVSKVTLAVESKHNMNPVARGVVFGGKIMATTGSRHYTAETGPVIQKYRMTAGRAAC
jgi:hypothetical protein